MCRLMQPSAGHLPFRGWGFYSPGLICPHGYTSACTATAKGGAQWPVQFVMLEGETAVGCCPTGYTCFNSESSGASCALTATSTAMTMATCDSAASMVSFLETYPLVTEETYILTGGDQSTISTTTIETMTAWAPMIQINWRSTDMAATPTSTPSSTASTSAGPTTAVNEEPSGTIPVVSIIGITVGCGVALLAACAIGFLLRRRRRTKLQAGTKDPK
ncbi:hypothetical protein F5883DRAFT_551694 [Diaporthe sp. PMI_573]|nr:hypothetical protein F5883DRAFT_551694 [Diaporthaceae sp. PMI_573]